MARFRGSEVKSLGDGFLILFDGPARAIHCAQAITEAMAPLGIKVRAGLHTGEVERTESDVLGIAVHLAARIMDTASASEVVISRTVKDLVAGSGIAFDDAGEHSLKGIEEKWQLFKVRTICLTSGPRSHAAVHEFGSGTTRTKTMSAPMSAIMGKPENMCSQ